MLVEETSNCDWLASGHAERAPLIYVAAPYTKPDPVENTHSVIRIADALLDVGVAPLVPHLSLMWHLVSPKPYYRWLEYDRQLLLRCDVLLRVPGDSDGATLECAVAEMHGIDVILPTSAAPAVCVAAALEWLSRFQSGVQDEARRFTPRPRPSSGRTGPEPASAVRSCRPRASRSAADPEIGHPPG